MYFLTGFGLFLYQTLDAIDGKQARRTGSSTPLGELFDHGCDSVSTGILRRKQFSEVLIFFFSFCYSRLLLCCTIGSLSMGYVLVLYVFLFSILLCSLANVCFW